MSEPLSPRNAEVARLRALARHRRARRDAGRFIVEGYKLVAEALVSPLEVHGVWFGADWDASTPIVALADADNVPMQAVSDRGIERISSTATPQPVLAEVELPDIARTGGAPLLLGEATATLALIDINDPGNVGTLARSAEAAGFDAMVVAGQTADPFGPKSVRASAGAILRVPIIDAGEAESGLRLLAEAGLERLGTRMDGAEACDSADLTGRIAVVLGSEAHGLGADVGANGIDRWIAIPMAGSVESLNVAMAGTILTYEVGRQHRSRGPSS